MNWADELITEYEQGRKTLYEMKDNLGDSEIDKLDKTQINSMIDSMTYSIDWMETGREPGNLRGVDKRDIYRIKQYSEMDIIPDITEQLRLEREPLCLNQEQRQALILLFRKLSDRERQCFIMYEAEQLSMQQIANRLGIKKSTVQQYIERAREKVKLIAS